MWDREISGKINLKCNENWITKKSRENKCGIKQSRYREENKTQWNAI